MRTPQDRTSDTPATATGDAHRWRALAQGSAQAWFGIALDDAQQAAQAAHLARWHEHLGRLAPGLSSTEGPETFAVALRQGMRPPFQWADTSTRNPTRPEPKDLGECMDWWDKRQLLQSGGTSVVALVKQSLASLQAAHQATGACIEIFQDEALDAAAKADRLRQEGRPLGPLHGMPLAHKDIFHRTERAVTYGMKQHGASLPTQDAGALRRLQDAGALNLARLHMTELAFDPSGLNEARGDCVNPWSAQHVPGGSSSGSGAVVAWGAVDGALGTDTGGSIRIPAALCGVTGLKPTYGRVSRSHMMALSFTNDHVGPLARTARDCALMMNALAGPDPFDPSAADVPAPDFTRHLTQSIEGVRIGVPQAFFRAGMDSAVQAQVDNSLSVFESLGARICEVPDFDYDAVNALGAMVTRAEASMAFLSHLKDVRASGLGQITRGRLEEGLAIPAISYLQGLALRGRLLREFLASVMADVDVLHAPVCAVPTPSVASLRADPAQTAFLLGELTRLNRPFNFLGLPALALPCGLHQAADGGVALPVGFQLIGTPFGEELLLAMGAAYQTVTDWHLQRPPGAR